MVILGLQLHSLFWQKYHLGFFFSTERGVAILVAYDVPLVTLILNIYGFVGLAPFFFSDKSTIFGFFDTEKGVAIQICL